ncbi:MAG: hypothetical protein ABIE74_05100 [Pseudomonadota bacterium]
MKKSNTLEFIEMLLTEGWGELSCSNPIVLSCGGIYIPPRKKFNARYSYDLLTTANGLEPVKVVPEKPLRNMLKVVLEKESLN